MQHIDGGATVIDEVEINPKPEGEPIIFSFCGKCKRLINQEKCADWVQNQPSAF